jgi:hypothetical protein
MNDDSTPAEDTIEPMLATAEDTLANEDIEAYTPPILLHAGARMGPRAWRAGRYLTFLKANMRGRQVSSVRGREIPDPSPP